MVLLPLASVGIFFFVMGIFLRSIEYRISLQSVEIHTGIFSRRSEVIDREDIKKCIFHQNLLERTLKVSNVEILLKKSKEPIWLRSISLSQARFDELFSVQSGK